jgi:hypothetical protein
MADDPNATERAAVAALLADDPDVEVIFSLIVPTSVDDNPEHGANAPGDEFG